MKLDKLSKRDFFKILGGGSAAAAIATGAASGTPPETMTAMTDHLPAPTNTSPAPRDPYAFNLGCVMDVQPHILFARFRAHDFQIRSEVYPFSQSRFPDPCVTNAEAPNQFYAPTSMVVGGIMVLLDRDVTDKDQAEFERNVQGELRLGCKRYEDFPMSRIAQRADLDQLVNRNSGKPTDFITAKMFRCDPPHEIPSLMYFDFILRANQSWRVPDSIGGYILFDGLIARGVQ